MQVAVVQEIQAADHIFSDSNQLGMAAMFAHLNERR